jgi:pimeloyl-ACP methyl ester carboxylesterase
MWRWLMIGIIGLALLVAGVPARAQDGEITLVPYTSEAFSVQGVQPDGWAQLAPGVVQRGSSATDVALLAQQAAPVNQEQLLTALLLQLGLTEAPQPVDTVEANGFTWSVYKVEVAAGGMNIVVDMALAEGDGKSYVILFQVEAAEYDALHEAVFLPALNALTVLVVASTPPADTPYTEEEVTFENGDITLAGTLTLPVGDGPHPAVVLISGSGAQDRNETIAQVSEIQSFKLIADALGRAGIAVLRYDDRGVGESTGVFEGATMLDFAGDTGAAVRFLLARGAINPAQIGLIGHSEGAIVAPLVALQDSSVAFMVALAGTAVPGLDVLVQQELDILATSDATEEEIAQQKEAQALLMPLIDAGDWDVLEPLMADLIRERIAALPEDQQAAIGDIDFFIAQQVAGSLATYQTPWYQHFIHYDPAESWAQLTTPVLGIFGSVDVQVNAEVNAPVMQAALTQAGNSDFEIVTIPNMNHMLQQAETGSIAEYGTLEPVLHPDLMPAVIDWLLAHVTVAGS